MRNAPRAMEISLPLLETAASTMPSFRVTIQHPKSLPPPAPRPLIPTVRASPPDRPSLQIPNLGPPAATPAPRESTKTYFPTHRDCRSSPMRQPTVAPAHTWSSAAATLAACQTPIPLPPAAPFPISLLPCSAASSFPPGTPQPLPLPSRHEPISHLPLPTSAPPAPSPLLVLALKPVAKTLPTRRTAWLPSPIYSTSPTPPRAPPTSPSRLYKPQIHRPFQSAQTAVPPTSSSALPRRSSDWPCS